MRDKFVGTALLVFGLVNAVPSLAAVNPVAVTVDYIDDDLTGSGMELPENGVKQAQRRHAVRLRLLSDGDRAALLRIVDDIPAVLGNAFPNARTIRQLRRSRSSSSAPSMRAAP